MSGEKTESATPHKLEENRRKGQVSQSQDIPKLLVMLAVLEVMFAMMDASIDKLKSLLVLPLERLNAPFMASLKEIGGASILTVAVLFMMAAGTVIIIRPLGGWIQFGFLFAPEAAAPKFDALNPLPKFKQMFSAKQMIQLVVSLFKAVVLFTVFYLMIRSKIQFIAELSSGTLDQFLHAGADILKTLAHASIGILLVFSVSDFAIQKYFYLKQNRMSHEDIKREHKQIEGDPEAKGHRKQVARQILNGPVKKIDNKRVCEADVVMVNPTHFAIGLFYRPDETPLPQLVYKAEGEEAQDVIRMAHEERIPVVRYIWLTRTLYRTTKEGAYIPRDTIKAVAAIYRLVRELESASLGRQIVFEET